MAFLDGAPPERLCQPMVDHFTARGGELRMDTRLKSIELNEDGSVSHLEMVGGEKIEADLYISAMPGESYFLGGGAVAVGAVVGGCSCWWSVFGEPGGWETEVDAHSSSCMCLTLTPTFQTPPSRHHEAHDPQALVQDALL
jgi:hypothetical protein